MTTLIRSGVPRVGTTPLPGLPARPLFPELLPPEAAVQTRDAEAAGRTALLLSPVRQGLESGAVFSSVARHHVENLLSASAYAVGRRDVSMLEELLSGVRVQLEGQRGSVRGSPGEALLAWFGESRATQAQTLSGVAVHVMGNDAVYYATFQNWDIIPRPACTAAGTYEGRLSAGPQAWRWVEHSVKYSVY